MRGYHEAIERFEQEAAAVLDVCGLPVDSDQLMGKQARNELESAAMLVIHGADRMRQELNWGRCERAMEALFNICTAYEDMVLFRDVPELEKGKKAFLGKKNWTWPCDVPGLLNSAIRSKFIGPKNAKGLLKKMADGQTEVTIKNIEEAMRQVEDNGEHKYGDHGFISEVAKKAGYARPYTGRIIQKIKK